MTNTPYSFTPMFSTIEKEQKYIKRLKDLSIEQLDEELKIQIKVIFQISYYVAINRWPNQNEVLIFFYDIYNTHIKIINEITNEIKEKNKYKFFFNEIVKFSPETMYNKIKKEIINIQFSEDYEINLQMKLI